MKAAVTGGSGVVGSTVIGHLIASGHDVVALARSPVATARVVALGAEAVEGDVLQPESLDSFMEGCDRVFHVAGINEMCSRNPDHMDQVNIVGTRNVLEAAAKTGVERVVHTSSAVTLGERQGETGSETTVHRGRYRSRYERSKCLSEQVALAERGVDVVIVNPSSVQGPGRATGTAKLILDVLNGRLPFLVDAPISLVDIDDCGRGHLLAADKGVPGERYVLSGPSLTVGESLEVFKTVTGSAVSPRFLPGWLASIGAAGVEGGSRIVGRHPSVCREMVRVLLAGTIYDGSRATRELGLEYTPFEETVERTVEWFRSEGLLD